MPNHVRGADLLVQSLATAGVTRLFTLSGNQVLPVFDACLDAGIELLHVRHEAAAVHMADAWGRLTGRPGVALVTAGPGLANTISAMYVAAMAESPVVVISGRAPLRGPHSGLFQDLPQAELAAHVAKASWTAADATSLPHDVARAFRVAQSGRPGPVHIAVPMDVLAHTLRPDEVPAAEPDDFQPALSLLAAEAARDLLAAVARASRPLILAGPSLTRGEGPQLLQELSEALGIPAVGMESPRGINDPSLGAFAEVLAQADLIVLIGKRLDFTLDLGLAPAIRPDCRFIQVDPDTAGLEQTGRLLGDASRLLLTEVADPQAAVLRLLQLGGQFATERADWLQAVRTAVRFRPREWERRVSSAGGRLHPADVCRTAAAWLYEEPDAVFVSDGGEFGQWAQACLGAPRRVINGPSGAIGGAVPFALAARCAHPRARILATTGDGAVGFHLAEFETAVRHHLPMVVLIGNDACWNAEHQLQLREYGPDRLIGCDLLPARYDELVRALGGHGENVTMLEELAPALQRAGDSGKPACVNVHVERVPAPLVRRSAEV